MMASLSKQSQDEQRANHCLSALSSWSTGLRSSPTSALSIHGVCVLWNQVNFSER